jgi:Hypothetical protein (DUF2513)
MKRDWDLVRRIMVDLESLPADGELDASDVAGYEQPVVAYHMEMMKEANLLKGISTSTFAGPDFIAQSLTWDGHELLSKIRQDTAWEKIKAHLSEKGLDVTVDGIKAAAKWWIAHKLGISIE